MLARLSLRFVLVLLLTGRRDHRPCHHVRGGDPRAPQLWHGPCGGDAASDRRPLLWRGLGRRGNKPAPVPAPVLRYGAWFALLALAIMLLHGAGLRLWLGP